MAFQKQKCEVKKFKLGVKGGKGRTHCSVNKRKRLPINVVWNFTTIQETAVSKKAVWKSTSHREIFAQT